MGTKVPPSVAESVFAKAGIPAPSTPPTSAPFGIPFTPAGDSVVLNVPSLLASKVDALVLPLSIKSKIPSLSESKST